MRGPARRRASSALVALVLAAPAAAQTPKTGPVVGAGMPEPLTAEPGDPARGRAIVVDRTRGLCLLCHSGPFPDQLFQGNLSPGLAGAGSRYSAAELRLRIADGRRLNPATIMPSYYVTDGVNRVGAAWRRRTILSAAEIEDVVAYLVTLKE